MSSSSPFPPPHPPAATLLVYSESAVSKGFIQLLKIHSCRIKVSDFFFNQAWTCVLSTLTFFQDACPYLFWSFLTLIKYLIFLKQKSVKWQDNIDLVCILVMIAACETA